MWLSSRGHARRPPWARFSILRTGVYARAMEQGKPDLSTTSFAILGQLAWGEATTYELVKAMSRNLRFIWPRAESRIYDEAKRLVAAGLATAREGHTGRRRRTVYAITPRRTRSAERLARRPRPRRMSLESEPLLRVILGGTGRVEDLRAAVAAVGEHAEAMLAIGTPLGHEYLDEDASPAARGAPPRADVRLPLRLGAVQPRVGRAHDGRARALGRRPSRTKPSTAARSRGSAGGCPNACAETEREGFEPSVDRKAHTRFPVVPVQPLRHLSEIAQGSGGGAIRWPAGARHNAQLQARTRTRWMRCIVTTTVSSSASSPATPMRSSRSTACTSPRSSAGCTAAPATRGHGGPRRGDLLRGAARRTAFQREQGIGDELALRDRRAQARRQPPARRRRSSRAAPARPDRARARRRRPRPRRGARLARARKSRRLDEALQQLPRPSATRSSPASSRSAPTARSQALDAVLGDGRAPAGRTRPSHAARTIGRTRMTPFFDDLERQLRAAATQQTRAAPGGAGRATSPCSRSRARARDPGARARLRHLGSGRPAAAPRAHVHGLRVGVTTCNERNVPADPLRPTRDWIRTRRPDRRAQAPAARARRGVPEGKRRARRAGRRSAVRPLRRRRLPVAASSPWARRSSPTSGCETSARARHLDLCLVPGQRRRRVWDPGDVLQRARSHRQQRSGPSRR